MSLLAYHGVVESYVVVRRERRLPRPGEVLKRPGQTVSALDIVARSSIPQDHQILEVAKDLGVSVDTVHRYILKRPGETVQKDEPVAARRRIAGLRRIMVRSPIDGEVVESGGGIVILEGETQFVEVSASIPGTIVESMAPWGVVVETEGAQVFLAWGCGDLGYSEYRIIRLTNEGQPDPEALDEMEHRGVILVVTAPLTEQFMRAAHDAAVEGIIGPSMDAELVPLAEELDFSLGLSEGFGQLPMSQQLIQLLQANSGRQITLDPGSPGRWRNSRPEIIIPLPGAQQEPASPEHGEQLQLGHRVRVLRGANRRRIGTVVALPELPRELPNGLQFKGAEIDLGEGRVVFAPFANLEHLG